MDLKIHSCFAMFHGTMIQWGGSETITFPNNLSGMESPKKQVMEVWIGSQMIDVPFHLPHMRRTYGIYLPTFTTNVR